jgi:hypothetical protein
VPANIYDSEPDFARDGVSARVVGQNAGCELLGATVYDLEPGARQADLHLHHANEEPWCTRSKSASADFDRAKTDPSMGCPGTGIRGFDTGRMERLGDVPGGASAAGYRL